MIIYVREGPGDSKGSPLEVVVNKVTMTKYYTLMETDKGKFKRSSECDGQLSFGWERDS